MQTREQIQGNVRGLVRDIVQFNRSKYREYQDICFDIQKTYGIDDHVDMLWNLDKMCHMLDNNEEAINELSDTELAEVEQKLLSTAQFIGLSGYRSHSGTDYSIVEADLDMDDFFNFPFNLGEFIRSAIPDFIPPLPFSWWSAQLQLDYLRDQYREGRNAVGTRKGQIASHLRSLRGDMKLSRLLSLAPDFMNIDLRNFLNTNIDGSAEYTWNEVHQEPWREVISIGAEFHQHTAPNTKKVIWYMPIYLSHSFGSTLVLVPISACTQLNAKFCHPDGREAVFSYVNKDEGRFVNNIFDKGTYNYGGNGGFVPTFLPPFSHTQHDIRPFKQWFNDYKNQNESEIQRLIDESGGRKANLIPPNFTNSQFWIFN